MTAFGKVLEANGFDKLAERFAPIKPAPVLPVTDISRSCVSTRPWLCHQNRAESSCAEIWQARTWT